MAATEGIEPSPAGFEDLYANPLHLMAKTGVPPRTRTWNKSFVDSDDIRFTNGTLFGAASWDRTRFHDSSDHCYDHIS